MKDTVGNITLPTVRHPLEVVRHQFEPWRKTRSRRGRIPEALWQAAAELRRDHSIFSVSRALRLNFNDLNDRVLKTKGIGFAVGQRPDLGFVKLDFGGPIGSSECLVEMEAPNGTRIRMSFKGTARGDIDPVELSRAFWRQGR